MQDKIDSNQREVPPQTPDEQQLSSSFEIPPAIQLLLPTYTTQLQWPRYASLPAKEQVKQVTDKLRNEIKESHVAFLESQEYWFKNIAPI